MEELEEAHMLRGDLTSAQQLALLSSYEDLAVALEGAFFVQVTQGNTNSSITCSTVFKLNVARPGSFMCVGQFKIIQGA